MWPLVLGLVVVGLVPAVSWFLPLLLPLLVSCENLLSTLSMAHLGYLQWLECLPQVVHFLLEKLWLVAYCFGLWVRVLITLYFADTGWWLSHCRYWSVWVEFLYTVIDNVLSASGLTVVSKKGIALSSLLSSIVNLMAGSTLSICSRKLCFYFWMTNVSSTHLSHSLGVSGST